MPPRDRGENVGNSASSRSDFEWFLSGLGQEANFHWSGKRFGSLMNTFSPMHEPGIFTRELPLEKLFASFREKLPAIRKVGIRSFHFGAMTSYRAGCFRHLRPTVGDCWWDCFGSIDFPMKKKSRWFFSGMEQVREGWLFQWRDWMLAAVWKLPVIFVVETQASHFAANAKSQFWRLGILPKKDLGMAWETLRIEGNK